MISAQSVWARECGLRLIGAYVYAPAGRRKHKAKSKVQWDVALSYFYAGWLWKEHRKKHRTSNVQHRMMNGKDEETVIKGSALDVRRSSFERARMA